jgi:hypothetical protein
MSDVLHQRREDTAAKLRELVARAKDLEALLAEEPLCIYVTGSYGRLEAVVGGDLDHRSDLDLFFLYGGDDPERDLPQTTWLRLAGRMIELNDELGFPAFSGDAQYLEVHNIARMAVQLGSRDDDSVNAFTARMLLLLESRPVVNAALYDSLMERVIGFYFGDFADHEADFRPTYLLNDILRFWRTLTLNYEFRRRDRMAKAAPAQDKLEAARRKTAEANVKLGFSRLSTCFSMVVPLAMATPPVTSEDVLRLTELSPTQRWESVDDPRIEELLALYQRFLVASAEDSLAELGSSIGGGGRTPDQRFGDIVFDLLRDRADEQTLRYVLV